MPKITRYFLLAQTYTPSKGKMSGDGTIKAIRESLTLDIPFAKWKVKEIPGEKLTGVVDFRNGKNIKINS